MLGLIVANVRRRRARTFLTAAGNRRRRRGDRGVARALGGAEPDGGAAGTSRGRRSRAVPARRRRPDVFRAAAFDAPAAARAARGRRRDADPAGGRRGARCAGCGCPGSRAAGFVAASLVHTAGRPAARGRVDVGDVLAGTLHLRPGGELSDRRASVHGRRRVPLGDHVRGQWGDHHAQRCPGLAGRTARRGDDDRGAARAPVQRGERRAATAELVSRT